MGTELSNVFAIPNELVEEVTHWLSLYNSGDANSFFLPKKLFNVDGVTMLHLSSANDLPVLFKLAWGGLIPEPRIKISIATSIN